MPLFDGAGVIGFGDDEPEPSVLGGVAVRLAVMGCEESLLAMLLFQLAKVTKPISSSAETAATQPNTALTFPIAADHRVETRIIFHHGSLLGSERFWSGNPLAITAVPSEEPVHNLKIVG